MHNYFSHARTALKIGLENMVIPKNSKILIPSFICNVLIYPIIENKFKYEF